MYITSELWLNNNNNNDNNNNNNNNNDNNNNNLLPLLCAFYKMIMHSLQYRYKINIIQLNIFYLKSMYIKQI